MYTNIELLESHVCFSGQQLRFKHKSQVLNCDMTFSVFLPTRAQEVSVPVLFWLSGLTCNDLNFVTKAGAQQYAEDYGIALIAPDTSPRGEQVPDDESSAYDFGLGAGFYLNATQEPWQKNYQMYDYIVRELPEVIAGDLPLDLNRMSIFGHSMGGHGALTIALKNQNSYRSVSAFSPICAPSQCAWGQKALGLYLGVSQESWAQYDAVDLINQKGCKIPMLVDQGDADEFLTEQLKTQLLVDVCEKQLVSAKIRMQVGYDHSYFFIASFVGEHIKFHSKHLL